MTPTARSALALVATASISACAAAQHADLFIMHDDPDGVVEPGQLVRFDIRIAWSGVVQVMRLNGDVTASPNIGSSSAVQGPVPGGYHIPAGPSLGTPGSGGLPGVDLYFVPAWFIGGIVPCVSTLSNSQNGSWLSWNWTAPTVLGPESVAFGFSPPPGGTGMSGLPNWSTATPIPMNLQVHGTTLVVTPAPAAGAVLALALIARPRRHHRTR